MHRLERFKEKHDSMGEFLISCSGSFIPVEKGYFNISNFIQSFEFPELNFQNADKHCICI